ncbi:ABC transporter ATP-binding protein [Rhizobium binxianense]
MKAQSSPGMCTQDRVQVTAVAPARDMVLEVRDLRTHFRTAGGIVRAVDGVSFEIRSGSTLGIVGESGSGKSVTSLSIMRLIETPGFIAGGEILYRGRDLVKLRESEVRRLRGQNLCLVFQDPMSALNPVYRVGDQVVESLRAHGYITREDARRRVIDLFRLVGIPDPARVAGDYPHTLSGGMRQRVTIAMAMANTPDLLILDEPTTALDVTIQAQILDLVKGLPDATVLLITHDIGVVREMCDEVVVMYGGRVMERGSVAQITEEPRHPYTRGLLDSIPHGGLRGQRLRAIAGAVPSPLNMPKGCPFSPRCPNAMDICTTRPELKTFDDGRAVACWLTGGTDQ